MQISPREKIREAYLEDEALTLKRLVSDISLTPEQGAQISEYAANLITQVRGHSDPGVMQAFLGEYGLSTKEGVALMCLAEALLRVPDSQTMDELIQDKIVPHDWASHVGDSGSIMVNASTWALMLTGKVLDDEPEGVVGALQGMMKRLGEPLIRRAVEHAMREMGEQFVLGQHIKEATKNGDEMVAQGYTYSYDMLGEAARTDGDALRYHVAYQAAIEFIAKRAHSDDLRENPGISVKLSALHCRYEFTQRESMMPVMCERLLALAQLAAKAKVGLNIDAEEADRLDLSLDIIEAVLADPSLAGWDGFGVVVQAYGQRAGYVIDWLYDLAVRLDRKIMVRLVKGAYWDTEIKRAQVMGLVGYPVFTRKNSTDISYMACARKLMALRDRIYPQFATHNAHTMAVVLQLAGNEPDNFEFQRLHGMGDALHDIVLKARGTRCRVYAPVGTHENLLAYLVRRLLENGANSSFVNQIVDKEIAPESIAQDPLAVYAEMERVANPMISLPLNLYGVERRNSMGWDVQDSVMVADLHQARSDFMVPFVWDMEVAGSRVMNPAKPNERVGCVSEVAVRGVPNIVTSAVTAQQAWQAKSVAERATCLLRAADLYEKNAGEIFALLSRESGKTLLDGIAELREAVDFLRYYAANAKEVFEKELVQSRGVVVCISPWNFPLAIFTGQIAAALVMGNAVLAKPAEQTPLIARRAVDWLHQAGIPKEVLQLIVGAGETVGAALTAHPDIAGVCFTGSTAVAQTINRQLAETAPVNAMLIAETGGINAMIVDSTALLEQAVVDIIEGAFRSAGQRCSALRMLYVQEDIKDDLLEMLFGAMDALVLGDPLVLATDVGPIIDCEARDHIVAYIDRTRAAGKLLYQIDAPNNGFFVSPSVVSVSGVGDIVEEVFGPVLHLASFEAEQINKVVEEINASGYGLTFGVHTRIDQRVQEIVNTAKVGNLYVNRNQIGAIVGSQPFGGEGLSGTGPKAGGPHYLRRFVTCPWGGVDVIANQEIRHDSEVLVAAINAIKLKAQLPEDNLRVMRELLRGRSAKAIAAAAALDCGPIDLPGPTGESNQLALHPLGMVICYSLSAENLLAMVVQALRLGNCVLAVGAIGLAKSLLDTRLALGVLEGEIEFSALEKIDLGAIAVDRTMNIRSIKKALAMREGPIVRVISDSIDPAAFGLERAICIDTTSAGGNADLLASAE